MRELRGRERLLVERAERRSVACALRARPRLSEEGVSEVTGVPLDVVRRLLEAARRGEGNVG